MELGGWLTELSGGTLSMAKVVLERYFICIGVHSDKLKVEI